MGETPNGLPIFADPEADFIQLEGQLDLYEKGRKLRKFVLDPGYALSDNDPMWTEKAA